MGLKAGVRDAAQAIRNLELVASLPRPAGFFDPAQPLGPPTPAEPQPGQRQQQTAPQRRPEFNPATANRLDFSNSDMAFDGHHLFMGSFHGFNVYDIEESRDPKLLASVVCPAGRGMCRCTGTCCSCRWSRDAAGLTAARRDTRPR